jgi:hypothetical protein
MSLHDQIANAKPPARTVELCLRGDLTADLEAATRHLAAALDAKDQPLADLASEAVAALRAEMAEALITVRFEAMPRTAWLAMIAEHEPRDGHLVDERTGFNTETFYAAAIRGSWAAPDVEPDDLDTLLESINARQFDDLADAAFSVNARSVSIPFGWRGSKPTPG